jgi:formylmethanofuran dehydrogenase subunit D
MFSFLAPFSFELDVENYGMKVMPASSMASVSARPQGEGTNMPIWKTWRKNLKRHRERGFE